jgi:hypothetical protein
MPTAQRLLDTGDVAAWAGLVRENLNHHGVGVRATVAKIIGYVFLYHDEGTLHVSAGEKFSNFATAEFGGRSLAISYSHDKDAIEIREGSIRGTTIAQFNDHTGDMEILRFFTKLVGGR